MQRKLLHIRSDVAEAIASGQAVVALESTIISHGMPYPQNLETALSVEAAVREEGALPATIALLDGQLKVGLNEAELEQLARLGSQAVKVSRRDLALTLQNRATGATTVAATMIIADMAGIRVFATGGIGGVHRGAAQTMDISADLQELANSRVVVVCAGAKAILDLGLTVEYLETQGVPVIGYQTDELPAFYSRHSGIQLNTCLDNVEAIAETAQLHWKLGLKGGLVVANPLPESDEVPAELITPVVEKAIAEAAAEGVAGKDLTPFLLSRIEALTNGASLKANIRLIHRNARLAAQIALAYSQQKK